ncbi:hypothetical protein CABS03_12868 [Colletotrichum abscissum]|uniref:Uncharacterized protein n=1 Tax=Colletotrichum abscissum TaxID=1671311 RepID=A0A9P9XLY0_9PEZI|nr:hypothetical protein CABS02_02908 [Colletotrichum abscissum]
MPASCPTRRTLSSSSPNVSATRYGSSAAASSWPRDTRRTTGVSWAKSSTSFATRRPGASKLTGPRSLSRPTRTKTATKKSPMWARCRHPIPRTTTDAKCDFLHDLNVCPCSSTTTTATASPLLRLRLFGRRTFIRRAEPRSRHGDRHHANDNLRTQVRAGVDVPRPLLRRPEDIHHVKGETAAPEEVRSRPG